MENEIDDIFNKAIEPLHTEPSDDFWRRAAENIIARGSQVTEKKAARWRAVAFILGAGLLLLGYFTYKIENGLENVDKQIEAVKDVQSQNIARWNKSNILNTASPVIVTSNDVVRKHKAENNIEKSIRVSSNSTVLRNSKIVTKNGSVINTKYATPSQSSSVIFNLSKKALVEHVKTANTKENKTNKGTLSNGQQNESNLLPKEIAGNDKSLSIIPNAEVSLSPGNDSDDSKDIASDTTVAIISQTVMAPFDPKMVQKAKRLSSDTVLRWNVTAYFTPDFLMGYGFKSTNSSGTQSENTIKSQEKPNFSYTAGASAEYALSPNFSLSAGIAYQLFSFNVKPSVIYNQKQSDGDEGYYLTTSSGIINCPYESYSKVGDSLSVNASSTRMYLEVPLEAKYFFVNTRKFRAYATLGLEVNFLLGENTAINWQNSWNESGTDKITNTEGSRNMYFSYYLGAGLSYKIEKCLSLYAEPGIHEAITPIDDNISLITYPKLFSLTVGIVYDVR